MCVCVRVYFVPLFRSHQCNGKHKQTLEIGKITVTTKQRTKATHQLQHRLGVVFYEDSRCGVRVVPLWCRVGGKLHTTLEGCYYVESKGQIKKQTSKRKPKSEQPCRHASRLSVAGLEKPGVDPKKSEKKWRRGRHACACARALTFRVPLTYQWQRYRTLETLYCFFVSISISFCVRCAIKGSSDCECLLKLIRAVTRAKSRGEDWIFYFSFFLFFLFFWVSGREENIYDKMIT